MVATRSATTSSEGPARWHRLPGIPERAAIDAGQIVATGSSAYVAVQTETRRRTASVRVWRWDGARWLGPVGGRRFVVNPDSGFHLTGGATVCLARTEGARPLVSCLRDGGWRQLGEEVFPPSAYVSIADAVAGADAPTIVSNGVPNPVLDPGGASYSGHAESRVWGFDDTGWRSLSSEEIPGGEQGTQRPDGEKINGRLCVGVNALPDRMSGTRPSVQLKCLIGDRWRQLGPAVTSDPNGSVDIDGVAQDGSSIYLGIIRWNPTPRWTVLRGDGKGPWQTTSLLGPSGGWRTQGSLFSLLDRTLAILFEQRPSARGLRARLAVRVLRGGRGQQVGQPLLAVTTVDKPVTYDLAAFRGQLLALHSAGDRGSEVVVSQLDGRP
jgi:hypothetical protein